jgi:hypothetical protein
MGSVSDVESLIVFQGAGHDVIRVQGIACEGGDLLYKESSFSLLSLFSIPSLLTHQTLCPLHTSSSIMSSYVRIKTFVNELVFNPMSEICGEFLGEGVIEDKIGSALK